MSSLSQNILSVLLPFAVLFSKPSWQKALTLLLGSIICTGKRTVCAALRAMGLANEPGFSNYHHLLNRVEWSALKAAKILFLMVQVFVCDRSPLVILVDETLERRRGKKIKAKGYYRDIEKFQTDVASGGAALERNGSDWLWRQETNSPSAFKHLHVGSRWGNSDTDSLGFSGGSHGKVRPIASDEHRSSYDTGAEATSWHQKEHVAFSDMLRAVRMVIWRDKLILRKARNTLSLENITPEMAEWAEAIVRQVLQAA